MNNKDNVSKAKKQKVDTKIIKRIFRYIGKYRFSFFVSLLFAIVTVGFSLWIPILVGRTVDIITFVGKVDFEAVFSMLLKIGASALVVGTLQWFMNMINDHITCSVVHDVRRDAFEKIQSLPLSFFDSRPIGETVSRVISDVEQFADGLLMGFTHLFSGALTILGTLIFMLTISWEITVLVVMITPISLFAANFIATRTYSMFRRQSEVRGQQTSYIDEMIGNAKIVQAFGYEKKAQEKFERINSEFSKASLKAIFFSSVTNPVTRFVNSLVYALVGLVGSIMAISTAGSAGAFTIGNLTSFLAYANQYTKPFNEISGVITELQNAFACASRVFALIDEQAEELDSENAEKNFAAKGQVSLKDVSFSYTPDKKLIEHVNIDVSPGQKVAIVGPTGCGKTTLINLLMRFYENYQGTISFDGISIKDIQRHSLRSQIGMVLQDTWIKSGTVRDNIIVGKPDATEEEIIAAAKSAYAHSFIKRLPCGYDTVIGEDGGSLSQGQKQLLCIARLMLIRPPMLILDEATSSIDTCTEIKIQKAFKTLMEGKTGFIVAHRLSTIMDADLILVMRDGNIVEQGTHSELISAGGFYSHLYQSQFAH